MKKVDVITALMDYVKKRIRTIGLGSSTYDYWCALRELELDGNNGTIADICGSWDEPDMKVLLDLLLRKYDIHFHDRVEYRNRKIGDITLKGFEIYSVNGGTIAHCPTLSIWDVAEITDQINNFARLHTKFGVQVELENLENGILVQTSDSSREEIYIDFCDYEKKSE